MSDSRRPGFARPPGERLLIPGSRFQRYRWVALIVAVVLEVVVVLIVHYMDSTLHPLDPAGAGVVFISVVVAGLCGMLVGLFAVSAAVVASFLLLADFSTVVSALNAVGSAVIWVVAAAVAALTVGYFRRQVLRRETALELALKRSLSARDKMERILDFSPQFEEGDRPAEVSQAICDTAVETFGSDAAYLCAVDGDIFRLLASAPPSGDIPGDLSFSLDDYRGIGVSLHSPRPSFAPDLRRLPLRGGAHRLQHELRTVSVIHIPIRNPAGLMGVLSLSWDHVIERPGDELRAIMQRFGDQAAIVWQNALRVEARHQADDLRETLDRVLALAPTFHITGSREEVAQAICDAAMATFDCTAAALFRVESGHLRVLARVPSLEALTPGLTFPLNGDTPLTRELRSRVPVFVPDIGDPDSPTPPWPLDILDISGARSALYMPLRFGGRGPRNLLVLCWDRAQELLDKDILVVAGRFADQAELALSNASAQRLHARLEANLLPSMPVIHPRLQVTTRYRTGEQRLRLGGDFVGSALSPNGALHFIIGDVSGHGPDAAALGATLRSTWRALALVGEDVPEAIAVMRRVLLAERAEPGVFATIIAGYVDLQQEVISIANIGHPPPLLIADRVITLDTPPMPPLGFGYDIDGVPRHFPLPARWNLLCYTDGLIDARNAPGSAERYGEERLKVRLETWTSRHLDGDALDELLAEIEGLGGEPFPDDVALLLISTKDVPGD